MSPASTTAPPRPEASPEAQAWVEQRRATGRGPSLGLEEGRRAWEGWALAAPLPAGTRVEGVAVADVPCERVARADGPGLVLLLHGGGYVSGSPVTHRRLAAHLSEAVGCPVLVPDYRLAPEHPFPAGLDDALAVWAEVAAAGPAALAGDSAGGGLACALMIAARDRGLPLPRAAALMSPWVDLAVGRGASYAENRDADPTTTREALEEAARLYAAGRDPLDPLLSPVEADLSGLPALLVQAGSLEVLRDDAVRLAGRARAAGVEAACEVWPGLWHVWHFEAPCLPEAREALDRLGAFLAGRLR